MAGTTDEPREAGLSLGRLSGVLLVRAAHPRQAVLTALAMAVAAALSGRLTGEVGLVLATVLVGQALLGWHNDLVDVRRDREHETAGKPLASGDLDPGTVWFAIACGVLLVVPLALTNGWSAGAAYLLSLLVGAAGNLWLRRGPWSWVPWVLAFALYPAFLSYGGLGGGQHGSPPTILMTVLAGLLGLGVHVLRALPGLVADHQDGQRHLPLLLALRTGAPRLLMYAGIGTGLVVVAMAVTGITVGLSQ